MVIEFPSRYHEGAESRSGLRSDAAAGSAYRRTAGFAGGNPAFCSAVFGEGAFRQKKKKLVCRVLYMI